MRLLLLAATVALCAPGCRKTAGGGEAHAVARRDRDPLHFSRSLGEPEYVDPGLCAEAEGGKIVGDTFEGLYIYGRDHTEWLPGAASGHTVSADGLTWTFTLRPDGRWSDGTPVTAHDFEWAWKRVLDPSTGARYASILWFIEGARAYNRSGPEDRAAAREAVQVEAVDDLTLRVRLVAPTPFFLQLTAFYTYAPVPRHVVAAHGDQWARPEHVVSNGPWVLSEWRSGQQIVLTRNPHYVATPQRPAPFDQVTYRISQDDDPAHRMYLSGEVDYLDSRVPPSVLPRYRRERFRELHTSPYLGVYYYMFNVTRPPFDDPRVRRALGLAVNKLAIGKFVIRGGQVAANTLVPPGLEALGYPGVAGPDYDPGEARRLLAEAGYPGGKGFPRFRVSYNTLEGHTLVAQFLQQEWRTQLGIQCDLDNMEWKVLLKKQHAMDFEVSRAAWIGDYLDANTFLELYESQNPNNRTGWANPAYDAALAAAGQAVDTPARQRHLVAAEEIFVREMPGIPLYYYVKHDLVKPWVTGYRPHLQGVHTSRWFGIDLSREGGPAGRGAP